MKDYLLFSLPGCFLIGLIVILWIVRLFQGDIDVCERYEKKRQKRPSVFGEAMRTLFSLVLIVALLGGLIAWGVWGNNWGPFVFIGCPGLALWLWQCEWTRKVVKAVLPYLIFSLIVYIALVWKFWGVSKHGHFW